MNLSRRKALLLANMNQHESEKNVWKVCFFAVEKKVK